MNIKVVCGAMKHKDRIYEITLRGVPSSLLESERFAAVTQAPFPALTHLVLLSDVDSAPLFPGSFIGRTEKLKTFDQANLVFRRRSVEMKLYPQTNPGTDSTMFTIGIICRESDWQFSALAQICNLSLLLLSSLGHLHITPFERQSYQHEVESIQCAELFQSFSPVGNLYIDEQVGCLGEALGDLAGAAGTTEILLVLQRIFPRCPPLSLNGLKRFIAARPSSNYPVTIKYGI